MDDFAGRVGGTRGRLRRKSGTARRSIPTQDFSTGADAPTPQKCESFPKVGAARRAAPRFRRKAPSLRDNDRGLGGAGRLGGNALLLFSLFRENPGRFLGAFASVGIEDFFAEAE